MRLSDIMSGAHLSTYAEIALGIFFAAFVGIVIYVFRRDNQQQFEKARHLPLSDASELGDHDTLDSAHGDAVR